MPGSTTDPIGYPMRSRARKRASLLSLFPRGPTRRIGNRPTLSLFCLIPIFWASVQACGQAPPTLEVQLLQQQRSVVAPSVVDDSQWIAHPARLRYDPATETLFALDRMYQAIVEFDESGRLVRRLGHRGEGPGELRNVRSYALGKHHVVVLDSGNGKIVVFRRDASGFDEFSFIRFASDLTMLGDSILAIVPGDDGHAFQLLTLTGEELGSHGDGTWLRRPCRFCFIRQLASEKLVIIEGEGPEGRILGLDGSVRGAFGFHSLHDVLATWREDFRATLRRAGVSVAGGGRGRVPSGKGFVIDVDIVEGGGFNVVAVPERLDEEPREVWRLDEKGVVTQRLQFDRVGVGADIAGYPQVFVLGVGDASVYEYREASR